MSAIHRNPEQAAQDRFDVIIVGGGIYGSMLMLEAARAGLKPLLLERADFGGGTSFNNLRIASPGTPGSPPGGGFMYTGSASASYSPLMIRPAVSHIIVN